MHVFDSDFYGSNLKVVMLGYLRPMTSFKCLGEYYIITIIIAFVCRVFKLTASSF
jgi:hypothetical protein